MLPDLPTIPELIALRTAQDADRRALVTAADTITYGELEARNANLQGGAINGVQPPARWQQPRDGDCDDAMQVASSMLAEREFPASAACGGC